MNILTLIITDLRKPQLKLLKLIDLDSGETQKFLVLSDGSKLRLT